MKKFFKVVGILLLLLVAFVLIAGIFVSKNFHLERDITINASRDKVWSHVSTLHALHDWSPWVEPDPNIKVSYEGQDGTVGAVYKWDGNKDVGSGEQTITKLEQPEKMESHLHFIKPFDGQADAYINLADANGGTKVTWGLDMTYNYPMNVIKLFVDMDQMMGDTYNKGLAKLKTICEAN